MYFTSGSDRAFEQPQPRPEQPDEAAPGLENSVLENPTSDNPTPGNPTLENPMQLNKDISSKEKTTTDVSITDSIPILSRPFPSEDEAAQPPERKGTGAKSQSAIEIYREIIMDNIEYEHLCQHVKGIDRETLDEIVDLLVETVCSARKSIRIMTPYFLPSHGLVSALRSAGQRGVDVRIVLPAKNNLFYVHWAQYRLLPTLLQAGVRVWYQPPPFAHTKLLAVDGYYCQIGSANLDARSLRLNFELNMEVFNPDVHDQITAHIDRAIIMGKEITAKELAALPLLIRLRNAACWIFSPYL